MSMAVLDTLMSDVDPKLVVTYIPLKYSLNDWLSYIFLSL